MASVKLRNITKRFGNFRALSNINLDISHREFVVIVGPSGCGKSTLLRVIAGLEDQSDGEILIDDAPVQQLPASKRELAMVFQSYALYPHKTVEQNMGFALKMAKVKQEEIDQRVQRAAGILRLEDQLARKPSELSGGQRQRVAIGRAIVRRPKVFLFDEPMSNLDAALRVEMRVELSRLHASLEATMVYVTHDQVEAMTMGDKIVVIRDGSIEQVGTPMDLYCQPDNIFVAGFIGSPKMNFFAAIVKDSVGDIRRLQIIGGPDVYVPAGEFRISAGQEITVGVRPEQIAVGESAGETSFKLRVKVAEHLGGETIIYGDTGEQCSLVAKAAGNVNVDREAKLAVRIDGDQCHVFDNRGLSLRKS